jgi:hypothetical protein
MAAAFASRHLPRLKRQARSKHECVSQRNVLLALLPHLCIINVTLNTSCTTLITLTFGLFLPASMFRAAWHRPPAFCPPKGFLVFVLASSLVCFFHSRPSSVDHGSSPLMPFHSPHRSLLQASDSNTSNVTTAPDANSTNTTIAPLAPSPQPSTSDPPPPSSLPPAAVLVIALVRSLAAPPRASPPLTQPPVCIHHWCCGCSAAHPEDMAVLQSISMGILICIHAQIIGSPATASLASGAAAAAQGGSRSKREAHVGATPRQLPIAALP